MDVSDWAAILSAGIAGATLCSSLAVMFYTKRLAGATDDMRDAAQAQARAAHATTLMQLGPVISGRISNFVESHRTALEAVERIFVSDASLVSAILSASAGQRVDVTEVSECRVQWITISEVIPDSVDGSVCGPKVLEVALSATPRTPALQELLRRKPDYQYDEDDESGSIPRWGTNEIFVIDEDLVRSVYAKLWPAIHDANEIRHRACHYHAEELLNDHIASDWRVSLVFQLAKTGFFTPLQNRRYKLQGKRIVVRDSSNRFCVFVVTDADDVPALEYRSVTVVDFAERLRTSRALGE